MKIEEIYRFRSINNLLGDYRELERQSIYFASPDQLNDPMEGNIKIQLLGDTTLWNNLFRHYILIFFDFYQRVLILGEDANFEDIPMSLSEADLPSEPIKQIFLDIKNSFLENKKAKKLISQLSKRKKPLTENELSVLLSISHSIIFDLTTKKLHENNLVIAPPPQSVESHHAFDLYIRSNILALSESQSQESIDLVMDFASNSLLGNLLNFKPQTLDKNQITLLSDFPRKYIAALYGLVFPNWYISCFMSSNKNTLSWGHYADSHKGACLIFKPEYSESKNYISLRAASEEPSLGAMKGYRRFQLYPVEYNNHLAPVDFFRSIGSLSFNQLLSDWHEYKGKKTGWIKDFKKNDSSWRNKYWERFIRDITRKSTEWKYEKEYRAILLDSVIDYKNGNKRTFYYDFSMLKGIIFGIGTEQNDKAKIVKIIREKCRENSRNDFEFYQAKRSASSKELIFLPVHIDL